eukprot:3908534-Rhodomonas_salina.2
MKLSNSISLQPPPRRTKPTATRPMLHTGQLDAHSCLRSTETLYTRTHRRHLTPYTDTDARKQ